jgi:hypothetical protein
MTTNRRRSRLALAPLVLWAGRLAVAQESAPPHDEDAALTARILQEERDAERRAVALARVRLSFPQRVSATIGAVVARQPKSYDCTSVCEFRGLLLQAEPGLAGGQLAIGWADVMGESRGNEQFLSRVYLGWGVKAALLRTWGDADLTPPDQTLVGVEGEFTVIQINFSLGLLRALSPDDARDTWIVTGGIGWGF